MRVYLDNCCYNRPFDDQNQLAVRLETEAKLAIQFQMRVGLVEYVWSDELVKEANDCPYLKRRDKILPWGLNAAVFVEITPEVEAIAAGIMQAGIKTADALHIACALQANCDWFFTVDRGILRKFKSIGNMRIANPIEYIQETQQ
ncbi:MAG: PIN domain-containing protein [Kiritimatiellae bacterium]|nr:PIN domain-containing protein [Kiritimatiellia bacterium]